MNTEIRSSTVQPNLRAAKGITGKKLRVTGTQIITFRVENNTFEHEFLNTPLEVDYSGILRFDI